MAEWQTQRIQNSVSAFSREQEEPFSAVSDTGKNAKTHLDSPWTHPDGGPEQNPKSLDTVCQVAQSPSDPVEVALASALERASVAGEWSVVAQLARELEARRKSHDDPKVVQLRPNKKDAL